MKKNLLFLGLCILLCGVLAPNVKVSAEEMVEHTAHITDPEFAGVLQEMVSNTFMTMSTRYTISWSVRAKAIKGSGYFWQDPGDEVAIGIKLSGYGYGGILDLDGNIRYVDGTSLAHAFKIYKGNSYCVIVQNKTDSKITAKGYFVK